MAWPTALENGRLCLLCAGIVSPAAGGSGGHNYRGGRWRVLASASIGVFKHQLRNSSWGLGFLSGPWNGKEILGSGSALYLYDIFPGCYAHLRSISYLFRSLHEGHVPSAAVRLLGSAFRRPVEWDGWPRAAAARPVPARRCRVFAKLQHQQFAEIDQQPSRLQPADHLAALGERAG